MLFYLSVEWSSGFLLFFPSLLLERNNDAQHFRDAFHFKRLCLHNLMKLQKTWGRGANNLFCCCRVKVNSELLHFRSSAFLLIGAESGLELAILFLHWKIWLVWLPELHDIFEYCRELHLGIKCFNIFQCRWRHMPYRQNRIVPNGVFFPGFCPVWC